MAKARHCLRFLTILVLLGGIKPVEAVIFHTAVELPNVQLFSGKLPLSFILPDIISLADKVLINIWLIFNYNLHLFFKHTFIYKATCSVVSNI